MKKITILGIVLMVSGCSTIDEALFGTESDYVSKYYYVTYDSTPQGANLICDGRDRGYTPVSLSYEIFPEDREVGYLDIDVCRLIWSSGATVGPKGSDTDRVDLNRFPKGLRFTRARPNDGDAEGLEKDFAFALKVKEFKAKKEQMYIDMMERDRQYSLNNRLNLRLNDLNNSLNNLGNRMREQSNSLANMNNSWCIPMLGGTQIGC